MIENISLERLIRKGFRYEILHQVIFSILLENESFATALLGEPLKPTSARITATGFDIELSLETEKIYFELKVYSGLGKEQIRKQLLRLHNFNHRLYYLLYGNAWLEWRTKDFTHEVSKDAKLLGYPELFSALQATFGNSSADIADLGRAYLVAIQSDFDALIAIDSNPSHDQQYYYAMFYKYQEELGVEHPSEIYSLNNRGGVSYCLNFKQNQINWWQIRISSMPVWIYYELVNAELLIKIDNGGKLSPKANRELREVSQFEVQNYFSDIKLDYPNSRGRYMTIAKFDHDFSLYDNFQKSLQILRNVRQGIESIAKKLS